MLKNISRKMLLTFLNLKLYLFFYSIYRIFSDCLLMCPVKIANKLIVPVLTICIKYFELFRTVSTQCWKNLHTYVEQFWPLLNIFCNLSKSSNIYTCIYMYIYIYITTQVDKSNKMTIVNFIECDLNKLLWIIVDSWMW